MTTAAAGQSPKVLLVSPLPPRAGGIGIQSAQWLVCMRGDGWRVRTVRSNTAERVVGTWPQVLRRAVLGPVWLGYLARVLRGLLWADVVVLVTSSYMTFHLKARPVLSMARRLGRPVVLWYKGGDAANFLAGAGPEVHEAIASAARLVVPSAFLKEVFSQHGYAAEIRPNLINTELFRYRERPVEPIVGLVTRSLEPIYNNACAIRAWALLRRRRADAVLWIAGEGPEGPALRQLADELCPGAVRFLGQVAHDELGATYDWATVMVNPTNIDNMPASVLEAQTAGLPVVSTNVGGVPLVVDDGRTGLLVPPGDPEAMAAAVERLAGSPDLATHLVRAAREDVRQYEWAENRGPWRAVIEAALGRGEGTQGA